MDLKQLHKAQTLIDKIENGTFQYLHVDLLFMILRESSTVHKSKHFNEIAHFVAHNTKRDRGTIKEELDRVYYSMMFIRDYESKPLDLAMFPIYVKNLLSLQLDAIDKNRLASIKMNIQQAKLELRGIEENRQLGMAYVKKPTNRFVELVDILLGQIIVKPLADSQSVINEMVALASKVGLTVNEAAFRIQSDKIIVSILYLLEETTFKVGDGKPGRLKVHKHIEADNAGRTNSHIMLMGRFPIEDFVELSFPVLTTDLDAGKWCDESVFLDQEYNSATPPIKVKEDTFRLYR